MKNRNGFVSNSSSSSFVIAVKKPEPCTHCKCTPVDYLEVLELVIGSNREDYEYFNVNPTEKVEELTWEMEDLVESMDWLEEQKQKYIDLSRNDVFREGALKALEIADEDYSRVLKEEYSKERPSILRRSADVTMQVRVAQERQGSNYCKDRLDTIVEDIDFKLITINKEIKKTEGTLKALKKYDESWRIFNVKVDNMDDKARMAVDIMLESGHAEKIESEVG